MKSAASTTRNQKPGFSVVDIVWVLTNQPDYKAARNYWKVLKNRLSKEGSQLVTDYNQLKLPAADGKKYLTDVANAETTSATGMAENQTAAKSGGSIAKRARLELENQTGKPVVTGENHLPPAPCFICDAKGMQGRFAFINYRSIPQPGTSQLFAGQAGQFFGRGSVMVSDGCESTIGNDDGINLRAASGLADASKGPETITIRRINPEVG